VTAVPAAAAAAPRLAVKAAPTAAPVLRNKEELKQVQLFKIPIFHGSHQHLNLNKKFKNLFSRSRT
jgi:hypothetical protein